MKSAEKSSPEALRHPREHYISLLLFTAATVLLQILTVQHHRCRCARSSTQEPVASRLSNHAQRSWALPAGKHVPLVLLPSSGGRPHGPERTFTSSGGGSLQRGYYRSHRPCKAKETSAPAASASTVASLPTSRSPAHFHAWRLRSDSQSRRFPACFRPQFHPLPIAGP